MTITLDRLPFDILFHIASSLRFDDIIHLGHTCRQLQVLLDESTLCRKTIEAHAPHSKEARLAQDQKMTYSEALTSIYDRREAFSNAYPFSARILGQGTAFTYRQGVLCVLHGSIIRVLDTHISSDFYNIDISAIINSIPESSIASSGESKLSLLYYSDGIIAVHYERKGRPINGRIFAIDTELNTAEGKRVITEIHLESSHKLFARHTSSFLYYGTYTGMGDHGHHEWQIRGVALDNECSLPPCSQPLQLEEFFGTDIGSTIAFEIHDGYFYALSNQTSFDVEELDWTSFYHCIRFPLDQPVSEALDVNTRVYRRQHAEGPIHDSWTDLTIQVDECTNKPMIVESRREWQNGSSRQLRTFYISAIEFPSESDSTTPSANTSPAIGATNTPLLPLDDPFADLVDSSNHPNYAPPQPRYTWNFHPEFPPDCGTARSFILARTKFRAYNYSCNSFLDLVEDERCCNDPSAGPCLRIRIGSRRIAPLDWVPADKITLTKDKSCGPPLLDEDVAYRHSSIKMWPPPASRCPCSKRLHHILNPPLSPASAHNKSVTGVVDERSLVYMVRSGRSYSASDDNALGTIIMVSFNREIRGQSTPNTNRDYHARDDEELMEDDFSPTHWQWTPGHFAACQKGECR